MRRWQQPIARFLTHSVGQPDLVQDLSQEVFLRLYQAGPRYRETGVFSTWLYQIALNVARDAQRRRRRAPEPMDGCELAAPGTSAEKLCEQQELASAVAQAVAKLPDALREVLVLHHYEELNFEQIARLTGTPPSTLKSRFAVALRRLRERLHQWGWDPEETAP